MIVTLFLSPAWLLKKLKGKMLERSSSELITVTTYSKIVASFDLSQNSVTSPSPGFACRLSGMSGLAIGVVATLDDAALLPDPFTARSANL